MGYLNILKKIYVYTLKDKALNLNKG